MLSLKKNISRLEHEDQLFLAALTAYIAAISAIRDLPLATGTESIREYRKSLRELEADLTGARDADVLNRSRQELSKIISEHQSRAEAESGKKEDDLRALLEALGEATQVLNERHSGQSVRLDVFANRLQACAKLPDEGQMRRYIAVHVRELRDLAEQARIENDAAVSEFRDQLADFSNRLNLAERRASQDALTGLLNRGEGEARLQKLVASASSLTAVLIDLNNFKRINDTWGHAAGDQVLKTTARVLSNFFRPGDLICRWGGDEFLVVVQCSEDRLHERIPALDAQLRSAQKVVVLGKLFEVVVSASIGVDSFRPGESSSDFVARVDADMYRRKKSQLAGCA